MYKKKIALFLVLLMLFMLQVPASADTSISVLINGTQQQFTPAPVVKNGSTLVPMRAFFEALGAQVNWDNATKTVTGRRGDVSVSLVIGSRTATVNGQQKALAVPAQLIGGSTFIPLRFVGEALGDSVAYDAATRTIKITSSAVVQTGETYEVIRVVDGDTFKINYNGQEISVRMIGVDTPESVHPDAEKNTEFGKTASEYTKSKLEGKKVRLVKDVSETDKYGRLLRYVYLEDGTFYNELLVKEGYAKVSTYPPDVKYADTFVAAERYARENNKGLWAITESETSVQTPANTDNQEYQYVGSTKSDKYHLPSCRYAQSIEPENQIWFATEEEAEKAGYTPCGVCKP